MQQEKSSCTRGQLFASQERRTNPETICAHMDAGGDGIPQKLPAAPKGMRIEQPTHNEPCRDTLMQPRRATAGLMQALEKRWSIRRFN
jgi:hypothetical protein